MGESRLVRHGEGIAADHDMGSGTESGLLARSGLAALAGSVPLRMILPGLLLTLAIIGFPILVLVWTSFHEVSKFGQLLSLNGIDNYLSVLADPLFHASLLRTVIWTVCVVGGTVLLSLPLALILNDDFVGRGLARFIVLLPWSISLTMTAVVWKWALNGPAGLVNVTLMDLGIISQPVEWLGTAGPAFTVAIIIGILVSIPFTTILILGGLSSLPNDIFEAAKVDAATPWETFRHVTLPLIRPFLNMAIVLNVIYVFNSFPIIWILTEGGPANKTDILVTYLYKLAFRFGQLGKAAVISLLTFAILLAFTVAYASLQARRKDT